MQLLSFEDAGRARLGVRRGESVVDLARADADLPESWPEIFEQMLLSRVAEAAAAADEAALRPLDGISFLPPIPRPPKILAIGLNYHDHAHEVGLPIPDELIVFPRTPLSFVGHKATFSSIFRKIVGDASTAITLPDSPTRGEATSEK